MKAHKFIAVGLAVLVSGIVSGQDAISYGFRAGISFSKFVGDSELDDAGVALDGYNFSSGFHIGFSLNYSVTDAFGLRTELLFSQRGSEYTYNGDSYYFLARNQSDEKLLFGSRQMDVNVSQASLEVPLIAYYKFSFIEISGGFYGSVGMANTGGGSLNMSTVRSAAGNDVDDFSIILQHNYTKDGAGQASFRTEELIVDGDAVLYSPTTGAYYDYDQKDKNMYSTFNFGITGGLALYLNDGLYLSGRAMYGLTDVDRNEYDISYHKLDANNEYIQRADDNRDLTIQVSVGFLF